MTTDWRVLNQLIRQQLTVTEFQAGKWHEVEAGAEQEVPVSVQEETKLVKEKQMIWVSPNPV